MNKLPEIHFLRLPLCLYVAAVGRFMLVSRLKEIHEVRSDCSGHDKQHVMSWWYYASSFIVFSFYVCVFIWKDMSGVVQIHFSILRLISALQKTVQITLEQL
jgi:K+-transporting ATPase A subunit